MKRLFTLLALVALVGVASATSLNFQNPTDYTQINRTIYGSPVNPTIAWVESSTGGNNYVATTNEGSYTFTGFALKSSSQTTYAAATLVGASSWGGRQAPSAFAFDSSGNLLGSTTMMINDGTNTEAILEKRWEIKMSGQSMYLYINGTYVGNTTPFSVNPSVIAFGTTGATASGYGGARMTTYWDDYVYGTSENLNIMGLPESDNETCVILQDMINTASSGLYCNGAIVDSNYMSSTWGRGNLTIGADTQPNQTIQLVNYVTGDAYDNRYTGASYSGSIAWDIKSKIINAGAPQGLYATYMPGTGKYSNQIWYKSNGATITFDREQYSVGDTATIISYVASGGYWNSAYKYKIGVMDVYGAWHGDNSTITTQSGSVTHSWSDSDDPGVYYAVMICTTSDGKEYILGYDWATLSSYVNFNGWVNNAQNQTVISGANVSMTQDGTVCNTLSAADGTYNCTGFSTGATWYVNATAVGFRQYTYNKIPLAAKGVVLNISMEPITPVMGGLAIGGVDRDTTYGRPIKDAIVTVRNTTTGLYCYKTTSMTGWYLNDETDCMFQSKTPYDVWAFKLGYTNSTTEKAVTV